jgi:RNA polymerase primary sigma factor
MKAINITKSITPRNTESFNMYLKDVSHIEMISKEEECELAKRIREGDKNALNKLVSANLRFVITVAKQYQGRGVPLEDLVAEGNAGMVVAATKFDERRGFRFISYAVWWIRQAILKSIYYTGNNVRLPTSQIEPKTKLNKLTAKFKQLNEREPSVEELSELSGFTEDMIRDVQTSTNNCVSIDAPSIDDSEDCTIGDCIPNPISDNPEAITNNNYIADRISQILEKLSSRDHDIICMLYGLKGCNEMDYNEISRKFALSSERIRQIHHKLIKDFQTKDRTKFEALL